MKVKIDMNIYVKSCQSCPFVVEDNEFGYSGCNLVNLNLEMWEELPKDKVHERCPLKKHDYNVKLDK